MGLAEIHQSRAQSTAYSWRSAEVASMREARRRDRGVRPTLPATGRTKAPSGC